MNLPLIDARLGLKSTKEASQDNIPIYLFHGNKGLESDKISGKYIVG